MEENSEQIGKEVIINYINAFNNRDYIAMADVKGRIFEEPK